MEYPLPGIATELLCDAMQYFQAWREGAAPRVPCTSHLKTGVVLGEQFAQEVGPNDDCGSDGASAPKTTCSS